MAMLCVHRELLGGRQPRRRVMPFGQLIRAGEGIYSRPSLPGLGAKVKAAAVAIAQAVHEQGSAQQQLDVARGLRMTEAEARFYASAQTVS